MDDILSPVNLKWLSVGADSSILSDEQFKFLIENVCPAILASTANDEEFSNVSGSAAAKQCFAGLATLFLEATKVGMQDDQLAILLDDCNYPAERKAALLDSLNENRQKLRQHLSKFERKPPHVVDLSWRLDYHLKNSQLHKVNNLQYTISLKQENSDDTVDFMCSREELQDLVSKLKEAAKALERASQF